MSKSTPETVLAAYIAAMGKRNPFEAVLDATQLSSFAHSLHRLNEAACNSELTQRQQKRVEKLEQSVREVLERAGLTLNHFNSDPRGYAVYVNLPDGSYNTLGGREHGWGIGSATPFFSPTIWR